MKKIAFLILSILFLSGCATYKFSTGQPPHEKGYVASRDDYTILEYTVGKDGNVPTELSLAKERLKRRRKTVDHYYKKMGDIENRFKMAIWDPPIYFVKLIGGVFRLPAIAISDYRYAHNPKYRERVKKREKIEDTKEEARINKLKEQLDSYIQSDLAAE